MRENTTIGMMVIITVMRPVLCCSGREQPAVDVVWVEWDRQASSSHDHSSTHCWPRAHACICVCVCVSGCVLVYVSSPMTCSLKRKPGVGREWDKPEATRLDSESAAGAPLR